MTVLLVHDDNYYANYFDTSKYTRVENILSSEAGSLSKEELKLAFNVEEVVYV